MWAHPKVFNPQSSTFAIKFVRFRISFICFLFKTYFFCRLTFGGKTLCVVIFQLRSDIRMSVVGWKAWKMILFLFLFLFETLLWQTRQAVALHFVLSTWDSMPRRRLLRTSTTSVATTDDSGKSPEMEEKKVVKFALSQWNVDL